VNGSEYPHPWDADAQRVSDHLYHAVIWRLRTHDDLEQAMCKHAHRLRGDALAYARRTARDLNKSERERGTL
jgi:hypothetical protein